MQKILNFGLFFTVYSVGAVFDCSRPSGTDLCLAGSTCDIVTGQCVCSDLRSGYNCGLFLAYQDASPCPVASPCVNGGTCLGNGTVASCYCTEDFVGDSCETPRYEHSCGVGEMTISVTPFGDFSQGVMYVEGDPNCTLTPETPGTPGTRYSLTLPHSGGNCTDALTSETGDERYTRRLVILYNSERITGRDEVITVNCGGDLITTKFNITVGKLNQGLHEDTLGTVPENADINFHMTVDGNNITSDLNLGDDITVSFAVTDRGKQKFNAIRIESCVATNDLPSNHSDYMEAVFITNSCHTPEMASVIIQPMQTNSTTESVTFIFEAFRFRNGPGDKLLVQCVLKLCSDEQSCQPVQCPGDSSDSPGGLGRRRRAAEEEQSLARVLTIKSPLSGTAEATTLIKEKDCTRIGVAIGVVIAMATVIFFLLVLCTTLILRECNNRKVVELDDVSQSSTCKFATSHSVI